MSPEILHAVRLYWIVVNLVLIARAAMIYHDAYFDVRTWRARNGHVRGIIARGRLQRERIRMVAQLALLASVVPAFTIPALLTLPVLLGLNSESEQRERRLVARRIVDTEEVAAAARHVEVMGAIADNTRVSQEASDHADHAYHEANSVNEKIADQGAAIVAQGEDAAADREINTDTNVTAHKIDDRLPS